MTLEAVTAHAQIAFDVVDVLGGFASLARRSPTLDGSVPVRVAQGCVPLLEGNAWGWQITLKRPIELRRRLAAWTSSSVDEIDRMTRAAVPMLLGDGTLRPGAWVKRLERGALEQGRVVSLFTGLFVRPRAGCRLRVSAVANRRSWLYTVSDAVFDDTDAFTPVVLAIEPSRIDSIALDGEVATLGILPATTRFSSGSLEDDPEVASAHVGFYDAEYFATKKRGVVVRKYRDEIVRASAATDARFARARESGISDVSRPAEIAGGPPVVDATVVSGGPSFVEPARAARVHRPTGPTSDAAASPDRLVVRNAVAFTAMFDGYKVTIEPDRAQLEYFASDIRAAWQHWQTATGATFHEGALLYLTKYITPHPPGEPHFFVKPPALVRTSPGSSTLIEGITGTGYDVLRGVVHSDSFHAVPAVFHVWRPGETITIAKGTPLCELFVFSRALSDATFTTATAGPGGAWS